MNQFKDYSLTELYNIPSPQAPGQINWKTVAIYTGITVVAVSVFVLAIHYSNKANTKMYMAHSEQINRALIAELKGRENEIKMAPAVIQNKEVADTIMPEQKES